MPSMNRCFCGTGLRPDGTCPFRCDPTLRGPRKRAIGTDAGTKRRVYRAEVESHRIGLGEVETRGAFQRAFGGERLGPPRRRKSA